MDSKLHVDTVDGLVSKCRLGLGGIEEDGERVRGRH